MEYQNDPFGIVGNIPGYTWMNQAILQDMLVDVPGSIREIELDQDGT